MIAYRHYITKNFDFSISLLIKVWWSSQNFNALNFNALIINYDGTVKPDQSQNVWNLAHAQNND